MEKNKIKLEIPIYKDSIAQLKTLGFSKKVIDPNLENSFQEKFKYISHAKYFLTITNFTNALHLAMCALDLKRGDKIICAVNSTPNFPEVVRHFDAEAVFTDTEKDSFHINYNQLEEFLANNKSKKIRGVMVSHLGGDNIDIKKIYNIIKNDPYKRDLAIVEDATDTIGIDRSEIDIYSDIVVYSLDNSINNLAVFTTNNKDYYQRAILLSNHGLQPFDKINLEYISNIVDIGCQYQASKISIAYGVDSLLSIYSGKRSREKIAKRYIHSFKYLPNIGTPEFSENNGFRKFIIKIDKNRDNFAKKLSEVGIKTQLHYMPLHLTTYYKTKYNFKVNDFPNALKHYQHILSIPIYSDLLNGKQLEYIIHNVTQIAKNRY
jgi:dTDP-4-amino-4,6-dideoxygalactose transaminase